MRTRAFSPFHALCERGRGRQQLPRRTLLQVERREGARGLAALGAGAARRLCAADASADRGCDRAWQVDGSAAADARRKRPTARARSAGACDRDAQGAVCAERRSGAEPHRRLHREGVRRDAGQCCGHDAGRPCKGDWLGSARAVGWVRDRAAVVCRGCRTSRGLPSTRSTALSTPTTSSAYRSRWKTATDC